MVVPVEYVLYGLIYIDLTMQHFQVYFPHMIMDTILSRRFLPGNREEILLRRGGELRLARAFPIGSLPKHALHRWIAVMQSVGSSSILVPDLVEPGREGRAVLSLPAEGLEFPPAFLPPLESILATLRDIHSHGLLHLDLASSPFAVSEGRPALVLWGDAALAPGMPLHAPEIAAGGFPTQAADYFQLGRLLSRPAGVAPERVAGLSRKLCDYSPAVREEAAVQLGLVPPGGIPRQRQMARLPRKGLNALCGGSWQERDRQVNEWVCSAAARGWATRVIRCSPAEKARPLPDRPLGGATIECAADLLGAVFPDLSGVPRLLVVDGCDFASDDLEAILLELVRAMPPNLAVVVTSASALPRLGSLADSVVEIPGLPGIGADIPCSEPHAGFWPGPAWFGVRVRIDSSTAQAPDDDQDIEAAFSEGARREIVARWEAGRLGPGAASMAASSYLALGSPEKALEISPPDDIRLRSASLSALGRYSDAEALLRTSAMDGASGDEVRARLAEALVPQGKLSDALEVLGCLDSTEAVARQAEILDMLGRPMEALSRVDEFLPGSSGQARVDLMCRRSTLLMRLGAYGDALASADSAVELAKRSGSLHSLMASLQERGRVREVIGRWSEALQDYRSAALYFSGMGCRDKRPPQVDLFVLETRMGFLRDASSTMETLRKILGPEPGKADSMLIDMLEACAGSMLFRGAESLPIAERGASAAALLGMPLRQGLCLLYGGKLLLQEGETGEAIQWLRHAGSTASLLGDRHLSLLSDIALAQAGSAVDPRGLPARAVELGLRSEELEARVLVCQSSEAMDALSELLELPSPLRACELASSIRSGMPEELAKRITAAGARLMDQMSCSDSSRFARLLAPLDYRTSAPEGHGSILEVRQQIAGLSRWLSGFSNGSSRIADLSALLPAGSGDESTDGAGSLLAPLVSSLIQVLPQDPEEDAGLASTFPELIGRSAAMDELRDSMTKAAALDLPVLLEGETGTGKDLVASALHRHGRRAGRPFIPVDCGAIPETLLEAELFGAGRGAYTDLRTDRIGLLEAAAGGTLFLDEASNLPVLLQSKLLRALESGRIRRLGENAEREVDFRLITAASRSLADGVAGGTFRSDLYYRIAVVVIRIPPLRERQGDIPLLAAHFTRSASPAGDDAPCFSRKALSRLCTHGWPGNVRELRNVVQRAVLAGGGRTIQEGQIKLEGPSGARPGAIVMESLEASAARHVSDVVAALGGNRSRAAEVLGCDPKTVRKYLRIHSSPGNRKGGP
jgi:DNA-binding NtrC family response regulator/tetratricopeptide (TPR) repeat protein